MAESESLSSTGAPQLQAEIARLNKIVRVLMDRAERSTAVQGSDFSLFQTAVMLEDQVRHRTAELEAALREIEKAASALRESEARFRGLVNQSLVGIVIIENGKISYSNAKFDDIFGYSSGEVLSRVPTDFVADSDKRMVAESICRRESGEKAQVHYMFDGLRKDGTLINVECFGSRMDADGKLLLISLLMDISERVRAERTVQALQNKLREQSIHDALTGLYNRHYLEDTLGRELIRAEREGYPVGVIMGDLDHFKTVNDCYGHLAGDEVLRVFGEVVKKHARASDICCRYGGEEFLLVLPGVDEANAVERAEQIRSEMAALPVAFGKSHITVTASFGIATFPLDGRTGDALISTADRALYAAKAGGRNRVNVSSPAAGQG